MTRPTTTENATKTINDKIEELMVKQTATTSLIQLLEKIYRSTNVKSRVYNEIYIAQNELRGITDQINTLKSVMTPTPEPKDVSTPEPIKQPEIKTKKEYRPKDTKKTFRKIKVEEVRFTNNDINPTAMVEKMIRRAPQRFYVNDLISSLRQDGYITGSVNDDAIAKSVYRTIDIMKRNNLLVSIEKGTGRYQKVKSEVVKPRQ